MTSVVGTLDPSSISELQRRYHRVRADTLALCEPLAVEDYGLQTAAFASPPRWHLAHTSWFFETFVLAAADPGYQPIHPLYHTLFNSYYQGVGQPFPRAQRGALSRPSTDDVRSYRMQIDERVLAWLEQQRSRPHAQAVELIARIVLGLQHEQQHQELLLCDLLYHFSHNPLWPAYDLSELPLSAPVPALTWQSRQGGLVLIGHEADKPAFAFDNETPRHQVLLAPYRLANRLISNGEYLTFIEDGGYQRAEWWLADGWQLLQQQNWQQPLYWRQLDQHWHEFTLHGLVPLDRNAPVAHVSYYEADAYARWAGKRLATEAEWEALAQHHAVNSHWPECWRAQHAADGSYFGSLWQWTASAYLPYPGFRTAAGAVGEYNGKFMCNQFVLRGSACITPPGHSRSSYRNFFYPHDRWPFTGIRLAEDV